MFKCIQMQPTKRQPAFRISVDLLLHQHQFSVFIQWERNECNLLVLLVHYSKQAHTENICQIKHILFQRKLFNNWLINVLILAFYLEMVSQHSESGKTPMNSLEWEVGDETDGGIRKIHCWSPKQTVRSSVNYDCSLHIPNIKNNTSKH